MSDHIVPEPHEIGQRVNVWFGARTPDGRVFLRNAGDQWTPRVGDTMPPSISVVLGDDNPLQVVYWRDLTDLAGVGVYVAYGQSPLDWKLARICTIPVRA